MAKASDSLSAGKYRVAEIQLKNVLQKQPGNAQAWLLLARTSLATNQFADAVEQFRRAADQGIDEQQIRLPMARALEGSGEHEKALELLKPDTAQDDAQKAQILSLRGDAYMGLGQAKDAAAAYQQALDVEPGYVAALVGQARVAQSSGDLAKAKSLLEGAVKAQPKDPDALEALAMLAYRQDDCPAAIAAFGTLVSLEPQSLAKARRFVGRSFLADCQLREKKYDDAERNIDVLMKEGPDNPYANYLQALVNVRHKDYEQATVHLQRMLKPSPDNAKGLTLLAAVKIAQDNLGLAEVYLNQALGSEPGYQPAVRMLTGLYFKNNQSDKAVSVLRNAARTKPDDNVIHGMLIEALARTGDTGAALDSIRKTSSGGSEPSLQIDVARAMVQSGDADAALALLNQIQPADANEQLKTDLLKVAVYLKNNDTDKALAIAQRLVDAQPSDAKRLRLLASAYVAAGRLDDAAKALEQAVKAEPDATGPRFDLGLLALREAKYDEANQHFHKVIELKPGDPLALFGLAQVAALRSDTAAAIGWLEKAQKANASNVDVGVALIRAYLSAGMSDKAVSLAGEMVSEYPKNAVVYRIQGMTRLSANNAKAAVESMQKAVELAPDQPEYRFDLARALFAADEKKEAVGELESLRAKSPDFLPAASALAMAQLDSGQADAALATADSLKGLENSDVKADSLRGDVLATQGKYEQAAAEYEKAYSAQPSLPLAMNLFEARRRAGDDQAVQPLIDWLSSHPDELTVQITLAQWYQQMGDNDNAIAQYNAVLEKDDGNIVALNNLALLYLGLGERDKALESARRAHDAAPGNPSVQDTFGWILAEQGQAKRALPLLRQAADAAPDQSEIQYHLAAVLARSGDADDRERAQQVLKQLLASGQAFDKREEAQKLLDKLSTAGTGATG